MRWAGAAVALRAQCSSDVCRALPLAYQAGSACIRSWAACHRLRAACVQDKKALTTAGLCNQAGQGPCTPATGSLDAYPLVLCVQEPLPRTSCSC